MKKVKEIIFREYSNKDDCKFMDVKGCKDSKIETRPKRTDYIDFDSMKIIYSRFVYEYYVSNNIHKAGGWFMGRKGNKYQEAEIVT